MPRTRKSIKRGKQVAFDDLELLRLQGTDISSSASMSRLIFAFCSYVQAALTSTAQVGDQVVGYGLASSVTYEAKNNGRSHRKFDATRRNRYAFDSSRCEIRIDIHQTNLIVLQECMALGLDLSLLALLSTPNMNLSAFVILVLPLNHLVSHHSFTILKTGARQQRIPS